MKKILSRIAIALVLVTLALSFTACLGANANTTPAYVNTYYIEGNTSTTTYIQIRSDDLFIIKEANGTEKKPTIVGTYLVNGNDIVLYVYAYSEEVEGPKEIARGTYNEESKAWTIAYNNRVFEKAKSNSGCQASNWSTYVIFGVLIVAIIGLFIWSSISKRKQAKKAQETVSKLKVGDRVKTIGGICGYVSEIDDTENTFVLEVKTADGSSFIKFDKGAIYQTAPAGGNGTEEKVEEKPAEEKAEKPKKEKKTEKEDK